MYLNSLYGVNKDWNEFYEKLLLHSSSVMQSVYIKNLSDGFVHGFGPPPPFTAGVKLHHECIFKCSHLFAA